MWVSSSPTFAFLFRVVLNQRSSREISVAKSMASFQLPSSLHLFWYLVTLLFWHVSLNNSLLWCCSLLFLLYLSHHFFSWFSWAPIFACLKEAEIPQDPVLGCPRLTLSAKIPNPPWWLVGGEGWHMISAQLKQEEEWFSKEWGVVSMRKSGQAELSRQKQQRSATSRVSHF